MNDKIEGIDGRVIAALEAIALWGGGSLHATIMRILSTQRTPAPTLPTTHDHAHTAVPEPKYDRALIAAMLDTLANPNNGRSYITSSIDEQIQLLLDADNAAASRIRTTIASATPKDMEDDGMCYCQEGVICPKCERTLADLDALHSTPAGGGGELPTYGIIDPDYARVFTIARCLAWAEGYALAMHGSFTRDLDLIAVPWTDAACEPEHLARRIEDAAGLRITTPGKEGEKPHGRLVWTLKFKTFGDPRFIDLSILPRLASTGSAPAPSADAREVLCVKCGQPTMHLWNVCFACSQSAALTQEPPKGDDADFYDYPGKYDDTTQEQQP